MFHWKYGTDRCKICVSNDRHKCSHRPVNSDVELASKATRAMNMLLEDYKERVGTADSTLRDMMPATPVMCFSGWDGVEKVWEPVNLKDTFADDGTPTHPNLLEYIRHVKHTEEDKQVMKESVVKLDTNSLGKENNMRNIDYEMGVNIRENNRFLGNVIKDLVLRGYKENSTMPRSKEGKIALLRKCLTT